MSQALLNAAEAGDVKQFEALVKNGADISFKDNIGDNALLYAAYGGHISMVEYLLSKHPKQFSLQVKNNHGDTLLLYAARRGHILLFEHLLSKYPPCFPLSVKSNNGDNALLSAVANGQIIMFEYLLKKYPEDFSLDDKNSDDLNAFLYSAFRGQLPMLKHLLSKYPKHFSITDKNKDGDTALFLAILNKKIFCSSFLIQAGSYIDTSHIINANDQPKLLSVFSQERSKCFNVDLIEETEVLLNACKNPNSEESITDSSSRLKLCLYRLELYNALNGRNEKDGNTALHYAIQNNHKDYAESLIANGADIDTIANKNFQTALDTAIAYKNHYLTSLCLFAKFIKTLKAKKSTSSKASESADNTALTKDTKQNIEHSLIKDVKTKQESMSAPYSLVPKNEQHESLESDNQQLQQQYDQLIKAITNIDDTEQRESLFFDLGYFLSKEFIKQLSSIEVSVRKQVSTFVYRLADTLPNENIIFVPALAYQTFNQIKSKTDLTRFQLSHAIMLELLISGNVVLQKEDNLSDNISILNGDPLHIPNDEISTSIRLEAQLKHYWGSGSNDPELFKNLIAQYALGSDNALLFKAKSLKNLDEADSIIAIIRKLKKSSRKSDSVTQDKNKLKLQMDELNINQALLNAARDGDITLIDQLRKKGADIQFKDNHGNTALLLAAWHDQVNCCHFLLQNGSFIDTTHSDPNANEEPCLLSTFLPTYHKISALTLIDTAQDVMNICKNPNSKESIEDYLNFLGNALNASSEKDGNTALHYAIENNHCHYAKLLIDGGADVDNIKNKNSQTALDVANASQNKDFITLCSVGKQKKTSHQIKF